MVIIHHTLQQNVPQVVPLVLVLAFHVQEIQQLRVYLSECVCVFVCMCFVCVCEGVCV